MLIRAGLASVALLLSGCASIVSGGPWNVNFHADAPTPFTVHDERGVRVATGTTPATVALDAHDGYFDRADYTVRYAAGEVPLEATFNGWYVGNIVFGGLTGLLIVDPLTGAMWRMPGHCFLPEKPPVPGAAEMVPVVTE